MPYSGGDILIKNKLYLEMIQKMCSNFPFWSEVSGKSFLISGATGMVGSLLIDTIMLRNQMVLDADRCNIIAISRNHLYADQRFKEWKKCNEFSFLSHDISSPLPDMNRKIDYLIHAASTADPLAYVAEPINTICSNIFGTQNMLDCALRQGNGRFLLCSSVEIYGNNRGDVEYFTEDYCGYLNCNTLRAGYPEAKRVSEALCQAYINEKKTNSVIIRLPRCYGPTMRMTDSKAIAQFIKKALAKEDIVLKSIGNQLFSFLYAADAVLALLWVLLRGEIGEVYNAGDINSDIALRDLAHLIAGKVGTSVRYEVPEETERKGYSVATKALLDSKKLQTLGWRCYYTLKSGIDETIQILQGF